MLEKRNWSEGSYIRSETDLMEEELEQKEAFYFSWFHTESNLKPSEKEEREKIEAIKEQIAQGVIQPNGMPVGYAQPKRKENKLQRQVRRKMERAAARKR